MPQVGNRKFAYTPKGEKQAAAYSKKTGQPMQMKGLGKPATPGKAFGMGMKGTGRQGKGRGGGR